MIQQGNQESHSSCKNLTQFLDNSHEPHVPHFKHQDWRHQQEPKFQSTHSNLECRKERDREPKLYSLLPPNTSHFVFLIFLCKSPGLDRRGEREKRTKIDLHPIIINLLCQSQFSLTQGMLMLYFCNSQAFITHLYTLKSSCSIPERLFKHISI